MQLCLTSFQGVKPAAPSALRCRCNAESQSTALPATFRAPNIPHLCRLSTSSSKENSSIPSSVAAFLLPVAAAFAVLTACPVPVEAGILSGSTGLESSDFPSIPEPDFLKKIHDENKKKYEDFDSKFKSSPFLQGLLKKSRENAELHKKEIEDKYCERGAEWGVGDCSLNGLPQADKDAFMQALRKGQTK